MLVLAAFAAGVTAGCVTTQSSAQRKNSMLLDSSYASDKGVTVVRTNVAVQITESMKNFEDNPNITRTDIDAGKRTPNKEVTYVNKGDKLRISEEAPPANK